jgi:nucleotide-binding universal stress UspA family protein
MSNTPGRAVVVGIDGSANSRHALELAAENAQRWSAPLVIVHAVGLTDTVRGRRVPSHDHGADIAHDVDRWCAGIEECVAEVDVRLIDGPPVDVLLRAAHEIGAGLIVVGRRGAGGRRELLLGSTAHQVAEHSRCPVLVVPPIDEPTDDA